MFKKKTRLEFRWSYIYDFNLSSWTGEKFDFWENKKAAERFILELKKIWTPELEQKIFTVLEKVTKRRFPQKSPLCYIVGKIPISAFSDPLTLNASFFSDAKEATVILIHELAHLIWTDKDYQEITVNLARKFPQEEESDLMHIAVNAVQLVVMREVFPDWEKLLAKQRKIRGLERPWQLVEKILPKINQKDILNSLKKIK